MNLEKDLQKLKKEKQMKESAIAQLRKRSKDSIARPKAEKNIKPEFFIIIDGKQYDVQNMAKGGRAGYKSGSKGCKLAMKGKGRAYGKNS